jgi:RimJ/RimL family protein N-acetyltransferase
LLSRTSSEVGVVMQIETTRLVLVPWSDHYLDDYARILSDPQVVRYLSPRGPLSREMAARLSDESRRLWQEFGFGPWSAIHKESGRWVGRIGLDLLADWPGPDKWEVGWELDPVFWGQGLATEGGREAVRLGFEVANQERIISVTVPDNAASRQVMSKCGLTFQGTLDWRGGTVVWYEVERLR